MSFVEFKNVNKSFDEKVILSDVSFTIEPNKIIGLLGKNGMGKTTIIKLLNGLLTPTSGEILINNEAPGVNSKKIISYLPERLCLDRTMNISQVIDFYVDFYSDFNKETAFRLLEDLNLSPIDNLNKMSKGMIEKLQLILVMSREADLYVLDEPLGGVDPATRDYILDTILSNFKNGASIIISTHLIQDIERILDDVIFVDKGKIILTGSCDELRKKHNKRVKAFREAV